MSNLKLCTLVCVNNCHNWQSNKEESEMSVMSTLTCQLAYPYGIDVSERRWGSAMNRRSDCYDGSMVCQVAGHSTGGVVKKRW